VRLGRSDDLFPAGLQADAPEQVVRRRCRQQRQDQHRERKTQQEALEGVGEGEVADVAVELRVALAELLAVPPTQPGLPPAGGGQPGQHTARCRHGDQQQGQVGLDRDPVALEVLLLERHRPPRRPQPERHDDVRADGERHDQPEDDEQERAGAEHGAKHPARAHRAVEQQVGPQPGPDQHDEDQDDEGEQREQQPRTRRHCRSRNHRRSPFRLCTG